jgi:hypothetical protein
MSKERKIIAVVKKSSIEEAAEDYLFFWMNKSVKERFEELLRLKKNYWSWKLGHYPDHIEKVVLKRSLYAGE